MSTSTYHAFLTVNEFSEAIRISRASTYRLINAGEIKTKKLGSRRLIPATEVERLVQEAA